MMCSLLMLLLRETVGKPLPDRLHQEEFSDSPQQFGMLVKATAHEDGNTGQDQADVQLRSSV